MSYLHEYSLPSMSKFSTILFACLLMALLSPATAQEGTPQVVAQERGYRADWFDIPPMERTFLLETQQVCDKTGARMLARAAWPSTALSVAQLEQLKDSDELYRYSDITMLYDYRNDTSVVYRSDARRELPAYFSKLPTGQGGPVPMRMSTKECAGRTPIAVPLAYRASLATYLEEHLQQDGEKLYLKWDETFRLLTKRTESADGVSYATNLLSDPRSAKNVGESLKLLRKVALPMDLSAVQPYLEAKKTHKKLDGSMSVLTISNFQLAGGQELELITLLETKTVVDSTEWDVTKATVVLKLKNANMR
jgi:hypothetical protein